MIKAVIKTDYSAKSKKDYNYIELTKTCISNPEMSFEKRVFLDNADYQVLNMIDLLDLQKIEKK